MVLECVVGKMAKDVGTAIRKCIVVSFLPFLGQQSAVSELSGLRDKILGKEAYAGTLD